MKAFIAGPGGTVAADISRDEALLLQTLASQISSLLREGSADDPAMMRLLPSAYPEDDAASAEFRRFTAPGLIGRKVANADIVLLTLSSAIDSGDVNLNAEEAQAWLRCLTDIRLTIASRLGIESDDQKLTSDNVLQDLYDWLGFVQNSLIEAVDQSPTETVTTSGEMDDG